MTSRQLLPTGPPAAPLNHGVASSSKSYMRRQMTMNACVGCRKKRTKCDGKTPCSRCVARGEHCDYKAKAAIKKDDLRAEVETLKLERHNNRAVLNALLLDKHEAIVQRLRAGEPVHVIAQSLATLDEVTEDTKEGIVQDQPTPLPEAPDPASKQFDPGYFSALSPTNIELPKWLLTPDGSPHVSMARTRRHSFCVRDTTWTSVTPDRGLVNRLIELFFSWEFPPFTMVCERLFLRHFLEGGRQFCSPALVNAIASVATRYMETADAYILGEKFFSESKGLLVLESQVPNIPSIQTFALLAMREMSFGREMEAQELCTQAVRLLGALDFEDLEGTDHLRVRCTTFSGVLSLTRAIRLITDQLSPASNYHYSKLPLVSDRERDTLQLQERMDQLRSKMHDTTQPKPANMLSTFIFDLTEHIYTFLSRPESDRLATVYQTCLESYGTISSFLKTQGDSSPCTLFAHIYFHFCLLALFRPFINSSDVAGASPRTVCSESVQSILDVTQSYANLFTLRRTPCFIPYFVFAAGLTRIVLEGDAADSSPSASGFSPATVSSTASPAQDLDAYMTGTDSGQSSLSPAASGTTRSTSMTTRSSVSTTRSSVSESDDRAVTQAVQQLEELSVGHPAAAQARWVLRDFKPH